MSNILIIDDEKEICESVKMILEFQDYEVDYTTEPSMGMQKLNYNEYDLLLLDIQMPGTNGFEILQYINQNKINISTIIISAHASLDNAIRATKMGAYDFIEKPIDRDKLLITVRNAINQKQLVKENITLKTELEINDTIIGNSPAIKKILETIDKIAVTDARVLITGENGTGKELVAKRIHRLSSRSKKELIEINCAAIPNELIESELFGHEKGSFTGAVNQRVGKFELADKGILFLDEVGDMSLQAQAKVLRALEDGRIERVGGTQKIPVDVRVIAATNKNLAEEIKNGNFREDLYHRLNVIPIHIPPLRERKEDIPLLVEYFTNIVCAKNKIPIKKFSEQAINALEKLKWKGNIRELRNIIERILIMVPGKEINANDVAEHVNPDSAAQPESLLNLSNSYQEFKEKTEKIFILKQLEINNWNIAKTAEILGMQRSNLYNKMKKYNIERDEQ